MRSQRSERPSLWLHRLLHYGGYLLGLAVIVVMGVTLFLRLVVIPEIDRYRPDIEQLASQSLGMPVHIGAINGYWQGLNPHFGLTGLTVIGPDGKPHLSLPEARATLSWSSLLFMDLRLARLELIGLEITARRDTKGIIYVADIPVNVPGPTSPFPDWFLRQHQVRLINSQLLWQDDLIKAPPLHITQINARMKNLLGHHQMGIKGKLPSGLGEQLDLRADLRGGSVSDRDEWRGELYMAVTNTQLDALALHTPWSQSFVQSGTSTVRTWIDLKKGRLAAVTGDIHLANTRLRFDAGLPDSLFTVLKGRIGWRSEGPHEELSARSLTFTTPSQSASEPADLRLRIKRSPDGQKIESGELEARNLRIETFTTLTGNVPIPRSVHDQIQALAPRGYITHASGQWSGADKYQINARFTDIGINAAAKYPGFQGASGNLEANEVSGKLTLESNAFTLTAPGTLRYPLPLKKLDGIIQWRSQAHQHEIHIKQLDLVNDDLEGHLQGQLTWKPGHTPVANINAQITQARGDAIWRYLPETIGNDTREWLRDSIKAGVVRNAQIHLKGSLDHFPFARGGGEFRISIPIEGAKIRYAEDWPVIDDIQGELVFDRAAMDFKASGHSAGTRLSEVRVRIADLFLPTTLLDVQGRAHGETRAFIDFVNHSPIKAYSGGFTEHLTARGQASLGLKLRLPLEHMDDSQISGGLTMKDNQVSPGPGLPEIEQLNGTLYFTQDQLSGRNLTARIFGEPSRLSFSPHSSGALAVRLESQLTRKMLAAWLPAEALSRLQGQTAYQLELLADARQQRISITSNLEGLAIQLPAPLGKTTTSRIPLQIELIPKDKGFNAIHARYGKITSLHALYNDDLASARIGLQLGDGRAVIPAEKGIEISGSVDHIDLDQWIDFADSLTKKTPSSSAHQSLRKVIVKSGKVQIAGRTLHDGEVKLSPNTEGWTVSLKSAEANGHITIKERPSRHIIAIFSKLHWPKSNATVPSTPSTSHRISYPGTVNIRDLQIGESKLGALNFNFKPMPDGIELDTIEFKQAHATFTGRLKLYDDPRRPSIFEDGELEIDDLGDLMEKLDYPGQIKGGKGTITARRLLWTGGLTALSPTAISGPIEIHLTDGRFMEVDTGVARLLGIISLQSLSHLVTLDWATPFKKGFVFDRLDTTAYARMGRIEISKSAMKGPQASVEMFGQIDLHDKTQALHLKIEPHLTDTLVAASGLAAGPIGLAGAWIASKVLKDQISQATPRLNYVVSGTWDKPVVTSQSTPKKTAPPPSEDPFP